MPSKYQEYRQMADTAERQLTSSYKSWTQFLRTAARLYKHVTFMRDGQPQNIRLRSLGEGYSEEDLRAVILGTRVHTPRRKKRHPSKVSRPTLISQIEAKIGSGKGAAYDQKLKVEAEKHGRNAALYSET